MPYHFEVESFTGGRALNVHQLMGKPARLDEEKMALSADGQKHNVYSYFLNLPRKHGTFENAEHSVDSKI
jgi:hypothetical protein